MCIVYGLMVFALNLVGCLLSLGVNGRWSFVINKSCFALQNWVWFTLMDFVVSAG